MAIYLKSTSGLEKLNPEVKLYQETGNNEDGSMTQAAITNAIVAHSHTVSQITDSPQLSRIQVVLF